MFPALTALVDSISQFVTQNLDSLLELAAYIVLVSIIYFIIFFGRRPKQRTVFMGPQAKNRILNWLGSKPNEPTNTSLPIEDAEKSSLKNLQHALKHLELSLKETSKHANKTAKLYLLLEENARNMRIIMNAVNLSVEVNAGLSQGAQGLQFQEYNDRIVKSLNKLNEIVTEILGGVKRIRDERMAFEEFKSSTVETTISSILEKLEGSQLMTPAGSVVLHDIDTPAAQGLLVQRPVNTNFTKRQTAQLLKEIQSHLQLYSTDFAENFVNLKFEASTECLVYCDTSDLDRMLNFIIANAIESLQNQGFSELLLGTQINRKFEVFGVDQEQVYELHFRNNGRGVDKETLFKVLNLPYSELSQKNLRLLERNLSANFVGTVHNTWPAAKRLFDVCVLAYSNNIKVSSIEENFPGTHLVLSFEKAESAELN
jgi:hypothetical protein